MTIRKNRRTAAAVTAALALVLTACGGGGGSSAGETVDAAELEDNMVGAMENFEVGTTFKATEPIEFSMLYRDHPNYPVQDDWQFFQEIEANQNVTFDLVNVPLSDWNQRRSLLIAAGDAPDVIPSTYVADADQYTGSGALLPISQYLEYMPNFTQKVEEWGLQEQLDATRQADGEFYVLPGLLETPKPSYSFAIRRDLFEAAGFTEDPATFDEFKEQMAAVEAANPDLTYVFSDRWSLNGPMEATLQASSGAFGTEAGWGYGDGVTWNGEEYEYSGAMDGYRQMVEYYAGLISDGLLDPESVTQDDETAIAKFTSGQTAVIGSNDQEILNYRNTIADNGHDDWVVEQIVVPAGPAGSMMDTATGGRFESGQVISASAADQPYFVAMLQFIDWLYYSDEGMEFAKWGVEGDTYTKEADGTRTIDPQYDINGLNPGAPEMLNAATGFHNGVFMPAHGSTTDLLNSMLRPEVQEFREAMNAKEVAPFGPGIPLDEAQREEATLMRTPLQDLVMQATSQFLLGQRSMDDWDAYLAELEDAGMSRYVDMVNEAVAAAADGSEG